jgi:flagellar hook-associated protein 1
MSILSVLHTGAKGLQTAQLGVSIAGNNVSNVGTEGYVRRSTDVLPGALNEDQPAGRRITDGFVEKRLLTARSAAGEASAGSTALRPLDSAFTEDSGGLGPALDRFQAAMQDLSARPSDDALRAAAVTRAAELANAFHNAGAAVAQARSDANEYVVNDVKSVNTRLNEIGDLNQRISKAEVDGSEASDLRDQRDKAIQSVADKVPVTVLTNANGGVSLLLNGGQSLVTAEGSVSQLSVAYAANGDVTVTKMASGQSIDVTDSLTSGSIGGYLRARDGAIDSAQTGLDQLAYDLALGYNDVHSAGYGLDGVSGRNLFEPIGSVEGAANAFALSNDVAANPAALATAGAADQLPSDNTVALQLASLSSAPIALGGMSVVEALASLTTSVGFAVQSAGHAESFSQDSLTQIQSLHDSVSGVSSDEEMVSLMSYQRAYQASLKVVQVADELLGDLMNLRG